MSIRSKILDNIIYLPGILFIAGVPIYHLFHALNCSGIQEQKGTAIVVEKIYQPQSTTYNLNVTTQTFSVPVIVPEKHLLRLRVENKEDDFQVSKDIYNSVSPPVKVQVTYKQLRLTGGVSVTGVIR
jgi:hypothetical protein